MTISRSERDRLAISLVSCYHIHPKIIYSFGRFDYDISTGKSFYRSDDGR